MSDASAVLGELAGTWFRDTFGEPTPAQDLAWPTLAGGESALVVAPTGSGKTLAAFLVFLERLGRPAPGISMGIRTGDTPQRERERLVRRPPDVLITTPESLYLMLTSERAASTLAGVEAVIVDEVHSLAPNKRGAHLAVSLERLAWLTGRPFQRVGLSATVTPADRVAAWLGGRERGTPRPMRVLDSGGRKEIDLTVEAPVVDFRDLPGESVWPSVWDELHDLVRGHRSTLIFVNNRGLAERTARQINERAGEVLCRVHHGSVSREKRFEVEEQLKRGELPGLVATSSLELGIDIGAIDLVVQIESPKSVTAGLQRVGRAGHLVGEVATGRIVPKYRPDLVDAAAVARGMLRREVETTEIPEGCLDVLAQHLASAASSGEWTAPALYDLVRGAHPFRDLDRTRFEAVLAMLSARDPRGDRGPARRARRGVRVRGPAGRLLRPRLVGLADRADRPRRDRRARGARRHALDPVLARRAAGPPVRDRGEGRR